MSPAPESSDVERAIAELRIAAEALVEVHQETPLARQFTGRLAAQILLLLSSHERLTREVDDAKRSRNDAIGRCVEAQKEVERLRGLIFERVAAEGVVLGLGETHPAREAFHAEALKIRAIREAKPE